MVAALSLYTCMLKHLCLCIWFSDVCHIVYELDLTKFAFTAHEYGGSNVPAEVLQSLPSLLGMVGFECYWL